MALPNDLGFRVEGLGFRGLPQRLQNHANKGMPHSRNPKPPPRVVDLETPTEAPGRASREDRKGKVSRKTGTEMIRVVGLTRCGRHPI